MRGDPQPDGVSGTYDGRELAAWRASVGVSQQEVADNLKVKRPYIARLENDEKVSRRNGERIIAATRRRLAYRVRMTSQGISDLERIRSEQGR